MWVASFQKPFGLLFKARHANKKRKRKRKDSAGSDDTDSMIKGGGDIGARIRQPPTAQTVSKKLMWVRGVVCRSTQTQTLSVVACVILQCIPRFYECRCMSDRVFIQFVCQFLNLMVIQIEVSQRFICIVFVDSVCIVDHACIIVVGVLHRSRGDSKLPSTHSMRLKQTES